MDLYRESSSSESINKNCCGKSLDFPQPVLRTEPPHAGFLQGSVKKLHPFYLFFEHKTDNE